ncbi:hypothetical protein GXW83_05910 [Streptacidiphilus sp. PB12-B1b]|uniref:hypothetical protein n=1 Tax=Streptacidiphilus sp. PB12-B1b TaxID=2705012 RepID=UPI0015F89ECF|nr:hypothetical protein [Streptacidiphilus sp. PB12-B1b]QMU75359.1 hypothetical protein GXW83_05910 [Streptacidiphilus sp. PB12-B1b]
MPRLTPAQICYGTLAVVIATVALLAASGTHSLLTTALMAILGITLGTIAAALAITAPDRRGHTAARRRSSLLVARNRPAQARHTAASGYESIPEHEGSRR